MMRKTKNYRILDMYVRFCEGEKINKAEESIRFGVDERSIQRDIDDIRAFLKEYNASKADIRTIKYEPSQKGYIMDGASLAAMTNSEILAVCKILLESRAFTKSELSVILNKLLEGCVPQQNMKLVKSLIANEEFHYVELHQKEYIKDKLWDIGKVIYEKNLVWIKYAKASEPEELIERIVEPLAILFSEYYFYMNAFIVEKDARGRYVHKYDYPAIFRIDRVKEYQLLGEKFQTSYANRFEEGEFRKRIQFMYAGNLMKVKMRFLGANPEAVLDRLPTAHITKQYENECIIEAEVYGKGVIMWLLSQGKRLEILKPNSLREEVKSLLKEMYERYI